MSTNQILVFVGGRWTSVTLPSTLDPAWSTHDRTLWSTAMEKATRLGFSIQEAKQLAEATVTQAKYPDTRWAAAFQRKLEEFRDRVEIA